MALFTLLSSSTKKYVSFWKLEEKSFAKLAFLSLSVNLH